MVRGRLSFGKGWRGKRNEADRLLKGKMLEDDEGVGMYIDSNKTQKRNSVKKRNDEWDGGTIRHEPDIEV